MGNTIQKKKQDDEDTFTCEICLETQTLPSKKFKNSDRCVHSFCTDCMITYIQVKIEDNVSNIKCPHKSCKYSLEPLSCRPKIEQKLFNKWCDTLCESSVSGVDGVYCPNKECLELILNECGDRNAKRCVCPACKKPFCLTCKVSWHAGYTCEESGETRDQNDVTFGVVCESKGWKRCPNCMHCIELLYGCNMVQCRCGIGFCYECGKQASDFKLFFSTHYRCCQT
ncbi:hypothetical protein CTI12_AA155330 [Artemisia annua]|uniref:RBR-type E3 ubiquitin transferase n=1 Tax=Artemisia annua TaxID=35608 RepID=A0A2U1P8R5_ARTAN|nr:hypothetical protein CTI12_AA155330 [Artemisia annua]